MSTQAIGTLGLRDNFSMGGRQFVSSVPSTTGNIISLVAQIGVSSTLNSTFRLLNGTSGYQVTSGKTLFILSVQAIVTAGTTGSYIALGYADNDVGFVSSTAFTNPIWMGGSKDGAVVSFLNAPQLATMSLGGGFQALQNKFPMCSTNGSAGTTGTIFVFGYEA